MIPIVSLFPLLSGVLYSYNQSMQEYSSTVHVEQLDYKTHIKEGFIPSTDVNLHQKILLLESA